VFHVGTVATNCVKDRSVVAFAAFPVARIVKEYDPALGVPESNPPADRDSPDGIAPVWTE
jgi:hypothetical protein